MRNNGFMTGIIAGAALGALVVLLMAPDAREPLMHSAERAGDRMRKMWRRMPDTAHDMMEGEAH